MDTALIRERLQKAGPQLMSEYGAEKFWIFGSRARGEERDDSDLDLLVQLARPEMSLLKFVGLEQEIEDMFGIKVDLVDIGALRAQGRC